MATKGPITRHQSIDEMAAQAVIEYKAGNFVGGDMLKRRMMNRFGKEQARRAITQARETYRILAGRN